MWLQESTSSTQCISTRRRNLFRRTLFLHGCVVFLLFATSSAAQECSTNKDETQECMVRPDPKVIINDQEIIIEEPRFKMYRGNYPPPLHDGKENTETKNEEENNSFAYFILNNEKPILYVSNFLNGTTSEELKQFCIAGGRFTRSPIRGHGDGSSHSVSRNEIRTRYVRRIVFLLVKNREFGYSL